jgi:hypothetical protein
VYFTGGPTSQSIKLPDGTKAFYFYVEPDPFAMHKFEVVAEPGPVSATLEAHGSSGAKYVGVYNKEGTISRIKITCVSGAAFASGEYGWSGGGGVCPGAIAGVVTGPDGPLRALVLAIKLPEKDKAGAVSAADTGTYEILDLPPSAYLVLCLKQGYGSGVAYPVEVKCDEVTKVPFKLGPAVE